MTISDIASARAFWWTAVRTGALREVRAPSPQAGEVRVRTAASAVSRGTERLVAEGRVPASQRARMRAPRQEGELPFPVKYGYAAVGHIEAVGDGVDLRPGERVFSLFPHQSAFTVPVDAVVPVPPVLPLERAVLGANMETAVNALWDSAPRIGDRVVVVGAGVLGLLLGRLLRRIPGVQVTVVDPEPSRAAVADALDLSMVSDASEVCESRAPNDLVFHTSATPAGLETALSLASPEGSVFELSWYGDRRPAVPLGESFHSGRLRLVSSQVGQIEPTRATRWSRRRRLALALSLLDDVALDALFSDEVPFEELPARLPAILDAPQTLCARVRYR